MRRLRRGLAAETGQTLLLTVGLTLVGVLLVMLVVDVCRVLLADRALAAAADAAATAGASAIDADAAYRDGLGSGTLPLSPDAVTGEVATYVEVADLRRRFAGFNVPEASTDGTTVTVRLAARVELPFAVFLPDRHADGYPIEVTARARAPVG